jgi:hypothetical protein
VSPTAVDLHAAVWALLDALPTVTAYDADVPTAPPADSRGRVYPYTVLWPSPGGSPFESSLAGPQGLDWMCQVTVAAGDPTWCLQAVEVVRAALVGAQLAPTAGPLVDETPRSRTIMRDPDVTPLRWFVPLLLGCLTA